MQKLTTSHALAICPLYQIVFRSRFVKTVVFALVLVIGVQPIAPVFADEVVDTAVNIEDDNSPETVMEIVEEVPAQTQTDSLVMDEQSLGDNEEIAPEVHSESDTEDVVESLQIDTVATTTLQLDNATSSTSTTDTDVEAEAASTTRLTITQNNTKDTVKTVATTTTVLPPTNIVQTDDTFYQFAKDDCVRVADGSFYCGTGTTDTVVLEDRFYVALDEDGDSEIFAQIDGIKHQITHNTVTDAAPFYDVISNTLVWHQDIAGRYQIMTYDFVTEKTSQLTTGRVNNMQPQRSGDITVWQQWGSDSWEIVMHDGETVTALTDNTVPDVNPSIRNDLVLWQTQFSDYRTVTIYDRMTKEFESIKTDDPELSFSNPRLLLVFEGVNEAGDVIAQGYDPETGKVVSLTTQSAPLPENIPDSEPTNEVRALLPVKPTNDEEFDDDEVDTATGTSTPAVPSVAIATTTESGQDIVVPAFVSTTTQTQVATATDPVLETIPDLVIPPATSTEAI